MHHVAALGLDASSQGRLLDLDDRLTALGIETVRGLGATYHLSLGVYRDLPEGTATELSAFAAEHSPVDLRLMSLGAFPGASGVLFLAPVVDEALLQLHRAFHRALASVAGECWSYYLPGNWVPHVTLAMDLTPGQLRSAFAVVATDWEAPRVRLDHLRLFQADPVRTVATYPLNFARDANSV